MPRHRLQFAVKQASGRSSTGTEMVRRKARLSAACPRCPEPFETALHVLQCPGAQERWNASLDKLRKWLTHTTSAPVTKLLIGNLQARYTSSPPPFH